MIGSSLLTGVLTFAAVLALGAIVICLAVIARKRRQVIRKRKEQRRQWDRARLLSSLEVLDLSMTRLTTAALQGSEQFAQERAAGLAQATNALHQIGDDELGRLVEVVVARCDALSATRQEGERLDQLVQQLGEAQQEVYRRMEALLDQALD